MKKLDDRINNTILAIVGVLFLLGSVTEYTSVTCIVLSVILIVFLLRLMYLIRLKNMPKKDNIVIMQDYLYKDRTIS